MQERQILPSTKTPEESTEKVEKTYSKEVMAAADSVILYFEHTRAEEFKKHLTQGEISEELFNDIVERMKNELTSEGKVPAEIQEYILGKMKGWLRPDAGKVPEEVRQYILERMDYWLSSDPYRMPAGASIEYTVGVAGAIEYLKIPKGGVQYNEPAVPAANVNDNASTTPSVPKTLQFIAPPRDKSVISEPEAPVQRMKANL